MMIIFYNFIKKTNARILFINFKNAFEINLFKKMKHI